MNAHRVPPLIDPVNLQFRTGSELECNSRAKFEAKEEKTIRIVGIYRWCGRITILTIYNKIPFPVQIPYYSYWYSEIQVYDHFPEGKIKATKNIAAESRTTHAEPPDIPIHLNPTVSTKGSNPGFKRYQFIRFEPYPAVNTSTEKEYIDIFETGEESMCDAFTCCEYLAIGFQGEMAIQVEYAFAFKGYTPKYGWFKYIGKFFIASYEIAVNIVNHLIDFRWIKQGEPEIQSDSPVTTTPVKRFDTLSRSGILGRNHRKRDGYYGRNEK
ncbi:MAG: hypothetical protein JW863_06710 [Chitinispirillaceae bacterium]|nr:hypothetical protein [Chitinispirillaceae bacterium]